MSEFLQRYMNKYDLNFLTADEAAEILAKENILSNKVGPKAGFNFRQMLRDGRDGLIDLIEGAHQEKPRTKWLIKRF